MVLLYNVSRGNACLQVIPACPQYLKLLQSGRKIYIIIALVAYVNIHIPVLRRFNVCQSQRASIAAYTCRHLLLRYTAVGRFYKVKPFVEKNSR